VRFAGKVAIVTGGSAGLGAAIALRLGQEGAAVVVADIARASEAACGVCLVMPIRMTLWER
jgi:NAD(P)-dependent dehydrogenase (short-subunit alcohol dehydrogenase family)